MIAARGEKAEQELAALRGRQIVAAAFAGMPRGDDERPGQFAISRSAGAADGMQRVEAKLEEIRRAAQPRRACKSRSDAITPTSRAAPCVL